MVTLKFNSIKHLKQSTVVATMLLSAVAAATGDFQAAAEKYSLETCRQLALQNNKELMVRRQQQEKAGYQKKQAFAAYLPGIDFAGGYLYNQKELSVFDSDQLLPVKSFDLQSQSYQYNLVKNPYTGEPIQTASGQYVPEQVALIPKESMTFDIHNVFFGAVTLTQPIYMGGKIVAMNKLAGLASDIADKLYTNEAQNVVYAVDAAYWNLVALKAKHKLATSYVNLLDSLRNDVDRMLQQGVATKSDLLSVDVKLNQANVDLTKVENGLSLSRMALAQLCGIPINSEMEVEDEDKLEINPHAEISDNYNMENIYEARPDLSALTLATKVAEQKANVERSAMLPNVALIGAYSFSNPNMFDGFKNRFGGAFSVGVMLKIPIWHWGGNYYGYKSAKTEAIVSQLQLENAKEKVELQVNQAAYKAQEAMKTYNMTCSNLDKAEENLRTATLGFREGVVTSTDVMTAQTAWLKANSEKIDATVDVQLCDVYLSKVLGRLNY
jgi:outer membrane protein TolC